MDETYRILLSISQAIFTKKQFQFLIETMQLYHFTGEQWNNLKAILIDSKDGFTDDQWKTVFHLLNENRLNDEQFRIFVDMLDNSTQKLVQVKSLARQSCPNCSVHSQCRGLRNILCVNFCFLLTL
jgi:hypothetical protein